MNIWFKYKKGKPSELKKLAERMLIDKKFATSYNKPIVVETGITHLFLINIGMFMTDIFAGDITIYSRISGL
ncbi:hypothetical protein RIR_jg3763.t1 [Rhizophagus irregularis DAOM 181602=DAOM 197198]|nr:hypothetical protein RIR_jg3763.t1 [Rhizophagus irregularis DAOM 181602=DAOM 197198]